MEPRPTLELPTIDATVEKASVTIEAVSRSLVSGLSGAVVIDASGSELMIVGTSVASGSIVMESEVASISPASVVEDSDWPSVLMGTSKISVGCARILVAADVSSSTIELLSREETISVGSINVTL